MGVPGFYRWLIQRYPLVRQSLKNPSRPRINNLYIDMNGIFYHALEATRLKVTVVTERYIAEVLRYLDMLVQLARPTDVLLIAVDGTAPFSKACQQRSRRFVAVRDMKSGSFDRTVLSPGSVFMEDIHQALLRFIEEKKKSDSVWMKPVVMYSSTYVPGEGEAKILNYVREERLKDGWNPNKTHVIYSNDADVIFLSLQTHEPFFMILREGDSSQWKRERAAHEAKQTAMKWGADDFEYLHMSMVRQYLARDFHVEGEELERVIDDFVSIAFLIGNDFVHEFADIVIQKGGFNDVVEVYKKVLAETGEHLVVDGRYNKNFQYLFLKGVVLKFSKGGGASLPEDQRLQALKKKSLEWVKTKYRDVPDGELPAFVQGMARSVMDAFTWVLQYYSAGCPSWNWTYPYNYSPPLVFVLDAVKDYEPHFELDAPFPPFLQQLLILPPQSAKWMASAFQSLMFPPSPIARFYPTEFEVDRNGRKNEWQAVVLLPIVDLEEVRHAYEENVPLISSDDLPRNRFERVRLYSGPETQTEVDIGMGSLFRPVCLATETPVGVPELASKQATFSEKRVPVICFEAESKFPSILIDLDENDTTIKSFDDARALLNNTVVYNWPYLRPGLVVAVTDGTNVEAIDQGQHIAPDMKNVHDTLRQRYALDVGHINFMVEVLGLKPANHEGTDFEYSSHGQWCPCQLTVPAEGAKIMELFRPATTIPPELGSYVVFTRGFHEGAKGRVVAVKGPSLFDISILQKTSPNISKVVADDKRSWISDVELRKHFGISFQCLKLAMTRLVLSPEKVNIALAFYSGDRREVVSGCAKIIDKEMWFPRFTVDLLGEYFKRAGNLLKLMKREKGKPTFRFAVDTIFSGSPDERKQQLDELCSWLLANSPGSKYPLVPAQVRSLSVTTIKRVETAVQTFKPITSERVVQNVADDVLSWPTKHDNAVSSVLPPLGQRVVCIASSGPAPYGAHGTVIAVNAESHEVSVLFDEPLLCGTQLEGLLTSLRGVIVKPRDLVMLGE